MLAITQIPEQAWVERCQALKQTGLLIVETIDQGISVPFLHFHPVLVSFLRSFPQANEAAMYEFYTSHYVAVAHVLYFKDNQDPTAVRAKVRKELPNLRRAMDLLLTAGGGEQAARMADCITRFLGEFGLWREQQMLRERVHAVIQQEISHSDQLTYAVWLNESGLGDGALTQGNLHAAFEPFRHLLARIDLDPLLGSMRREIG